MRQFSTMPKKKGSNIMPSPTPEPFMTIDDCVRRAQELSAGLSKLSDITYPLHIRRGIRKEVTPPMQDKQASKQLKAAGRTYFFDVEQTREGKAYLRITESRKGKSDTFERNSINVFPGDATDFSQAVSEMIKELN
jgi:uncharacterized protein DUF3276